MGMTTDGLSHWRAETEAWCAEHGLAWREDPTNATDAYARHGAARDDGRQVNTHTDRP